MTSNFEKFLRGASKKCGEFSGSAPHKGWPQSFRKADAAEHRFFAEGKEYLKPQTFVATLASSAKLQDAAISWFPRR